MRDSENTARITGYATAIVGLILLLYIISSLRMAFLFPHNRVKVQFPNIGTLIVDDPVKLRGVEIGKVADIATGVNGPLVTLELYRHFKLPKDSRFIDYNYSLFGARMIILVMGESAEPMNQDRIQRGNFIYGITESIHQVESLLKTVIEYRDLSLRLEKGGKGNPSLQQLLSTQVYPALQEFQRFSQSLDTLQYGVTVKLGQLMETTGKLNRYGTAMATHSDSMVARTGRTLEELTVLTTRGEVVMQGLEQVLDAAQDTTRGASRLLLQRDLYDKTLIFTQALQDFLRLTREQGLEDVIHFWRNVHFHSRAKNK